MDSNLQDQRMERTFELNEAMQEEAFLQNTESLLTELSTLVDTIKSYQTPLVTDQFIDDCLKEQL